MNRRAPADERRFIVTVVCALILQVPAWDILGAPERDPDEEEEWSRMTRGLEVLWSGSPAEKRAIAGDAEAIFEPLDWADDDDADAQHVAASLREFIRVEDDDWIVSRLLEGLIEFDTDLLGPVFRGALRSRSINVVRRGLQWFADNEDQDAAPLPEEVSGRTLPPWVRADLVGALVEHGPMAHFEEFLSLAGDEEADIALAAIEALQSIGDPRAVPLLATVARQGKPGPRLAALRALGDWPEAAEALETLLEAAASDQAGIQHAAISAMWRIEEGGATPAIVRLAHAGASGKVRLHAIGALSWRRQIEAVEGLVAILHEPPSDEVRELQAEVLAILHNFDNPAAIPGLYGVDASLGFEPSGTVGDLIAYLSRDRAATRRTWIWRPAKRDKGGSPDPDDPGVRRVLPPPGSISVRCYEAPGVAGDPAIYVRLPGRTLVRVGDRFEREDDTWLRLEGGFSPYCWVPRSLVEEPEEGAPAADAGGPGLIRLELDLPAAALGSDAARGLLAAGILETFDPEGEIVGAALVVDPDARDDLVLLIESRAGVDVLLAARLDALRKRAGDRWPDDPGADSAHEEVPPPAGEE